MTGKNGYDENSTLSALRKAYEMELETVANYLANSVNLDGVLAEEVKNSLASDVQAELGHAQQLARRIKQLGGVVPNAKELAFDRSHLEPLAKTTDVEDVVRGVLGDEKAAIDHYRSIIEMTEGHDYVTQELCIQLLGDEEQHRTQFAGFLKEFTSA